MKFFKKTCAEHEKLYYCINVLSLKVLKSVDSSRGSKKRGLNHALSPSINCLFLDWFFALFEVLEPGPHDTILHLTLLLVVISRR